LHVKTENNNGVMGDYPSSLQIFTPVTYWPRKLGTILLC